MRYVNILTTASTIALLCGAASVPAQAPVNDPSARLKQVLPADVATRVLAVIATARARQLPAEALENRALKFAARGVGPNSIERSVVEQEARMEKAKEILDGARGRRADDDEVEAAAEALRKGVDGPKVAELAKSAPSSRSLAVPLYVIGSLLDRGLPSTAALQRVEEKLHARASDGDLESIPSEVQSQGAVGQGHKPAETGRALGETKNPGGARGAQNGNGAGGPPSGFPANGGAKAKPTSPPGLGNKPGTPPGKRP
jgi:hypothetical protein